MCDGTLNLSTCIFCYCCMHSPSYLLMTLYSADSARKRDLKIDPNAARPAAASIQSIPSRDQQLHACRFTYWLAVASVHSCRRRSKLVDD